MRSCAWSWFGFPQWHCQEQGFQWKSIWEVISRKAGREGEELMKAHYRAGDVVAAGVWSCWTLGNNEAQPANWALRDEGAGYLKPAGAGNYLVLLACFACRRSGLWWPEKPQPLTQVLAAGVICFRTCCLGYGEGGCAVPESNLQTPKAHSSIPAQCLLAVCLWENHLHFLFLSFLIHNMGVIILPIVRIKWLCKYKELKTVPGTE